MGGISGAPLDDVWYVDASGFTQMQGLGPSARFGHRMTYNPLRRQMVMVGGNSGSGGNDNVLDEVWRFRTASADRPALRVAISVGAAQVPIDELIEVSVSSDGDVLAPQVWRLGRFEPLADATIDRGLLVGDEATLHLIFSSFTVGEDAVASLGDVSATVSFRSN